MEYSIEIEIDFRNRLKDTMKDFTDYLFRFFYSYWSNYINKN